VSVTKEQPFAVLLQPDAGRDFSTWMQQLTDRAVTTPKKELGNLLRQGSVRKFIDTVLVKYGYDLHMHIGNMSKQQRHDLASLL